MSESTEAETCTACGVVLDDETAFRLSRAGRSYCCRCYLKHDIWGRPFPVALNAEKGYGFSPTGAPRDVPLWSPVET